MLKNYVATKGDLKAVNEALKFVQHPKMKFVFRDFSRIKNTKVVSYDNQSIYVWQVKPIRLLKIPHEIEIKNEWQYAWQAGIISDKIEELLKAKMRPLDGLKTPIISGGLLAPFITLQNAKKVPDNPYVTKESYLATIIHEFGHVFWNSFKLWWESDKKQNLEILSLSNKLYLGKKVTIKQLPVYPIHFNVGEVFAYCTEYYASEQFWPSHKNKLDKFIIKRLSLLIKMEKGKDLNSEDSVLSLSKFPYDSAFVRGKILMYNYPQTWPIKLTKS